MLSSLRVRNFVLVDDVQLELGAGLNVLTGETGAGKSILLAALGLLRGARGDRTAIRRGAEALEVEGVFAASPAVRRQLGALDLPREGATLILRREVRRSGGTRCLVNGQRVLVATLRTLGSQLVDIHGQRDEERFRGPAAQRDLLDLYGEHGPLRRAVRAAYRRSAEAAAARAVHAERLKTLGRDADWMRYQLEEIRALDARPEELESLRAVVGERRAAVREERLLARSEELLNGGEQPALGALEELDQRWAQEAPAEGEWGALRAQVRDLARVARRTHQALRRLGRAAEASEAELDGLEQRLTALEQVVRKHRRTLPELLAYAETLEARLAELAAGEMRGEELERAAEKTRQALARAAARLRAKRERAGPQLAAALSGELGAMRMNGCRLQVELRPWGAAGAGGEPVRPSGSEAVRFLVETNPGQGFEALGRIASGGEMARVALALRVVLGARGHPRLAVFDEIDAGLGGTAARAVAGRLAQVARHHQVLLVTHLPVIAARADGHFRVTKGIRGEQTRVSVERLGKSARVAELARMLSGEAGDHEARRHARALLQGAFRLPEDAGSDTK